jgi:hypothetical protein
MTAGNPAAAAARIEIPEETAYRSLTGWQKLLVAARAAGFSESAGHQLVCVGCCPVVNIDRPWPGSSDAIATNFLRQRRNRRTWC